MELGLLHTGRVDYLGEDHEHDELRVWPAGLHAKEACHG
jgi:hypothetical protein